MDIDKAGILVVNYSERLVTLLREVRQLSELGHPIPSKISKAGFLVACKDSYTGNRSFAAPVFVKQNDIILSHVGID